ncbi:MAG: HlyC/CorC family transporter [Lachnospiraceae bacterium]|nr:HlyC/CorC family transporter [Lachnospiraceae bacterium]
MDPSDAAKLIILFILVILSGFLSASETALSAVNKFRIRSLAEDNIRGAKTVSRLIEEPSKMLSALLISVNILHLSAAALATSLVIDYFQRKWIGISIGIFVFLFLTLVVITPKSISSIHAENFALFAAVPILFLTKLLTPLIFIMNKLSNGILLLFGIDPNEKPTSITENELREILDFSHDEGVIETEERRMITNVVDFGDSLAKDVMVPRIDMAFANVDSTYEELVQAFAEDKYTRLPVYSESRDNVIGVVNLKDLFFYTGNKADFHISDIMRDAYFTYEFKKTSELLIEMRKDSIPMEIVLDEYGATAGLITIEDLLEEIVGEIRDEYDDDEVDCIQPVSDHEYIVDGNTKLDDINESLGLDIQSDDYDSIAGHIIYLLDHLPEEGETVTEGKAVFTVASTDKNRIDKVHILLMNEETPPEEDENENLIDE